MAELPSATTTIDETSGSFAGGAAYCVVMACAAANADGVPRVFSSAKALLAEHSYSPGADYVALHVEATKKPIIFVGLPVATAGVVGRQNSSRVVGTCAITVAAASAGIMEETNASVTVVDGGTIGVNGITFYLSLDGGRTSKLIRLKTAATYAVPYVGIVLNFAAGTLIADDVYTFTTTAPMWDDTGLTAARNALAAQLKLSRSWMVIGDLVNSTFAGYVTTQVNAYETANDRFVYARGQVRDRLPLAAMARATVRMTGTPTLTFLEVGASADTITRSAGSFIADGFAVGDIVTVAGSVSNNVTATVAGVSALVLTLGATLPNDDLANEGPVSNCTIVGSNGLIFTTTTATRSGGSWLNDGFRVGDSVTFAGTQLNNATFTITVLTATVMTFASGGVAEAVATRTATCVKGETMAAWVALMDTAFTSVDGQKRLDLAAGRARKVSPITGWNFRRPAAWAASIREYQHDVQIPCWRKSDGPLDGWDMTDGNGNVAEYDERSDGGGLAARFTCLRTWANGPSGAFVALGLTRDTEGAILSRTHNMAVANVVCTTVQAECENAIGQVLILNDNGTGTEESLGILEGRVNSKLARAVLQSGPEGPRASKAVWSASRTDVLSGVNASLTGSVDLEENGTLEHITTTVRVR